MWEKRRKKYVQIVASKTAHALSVLLDMGKPFIGMMPTMHFMVEFMSSSAPPTHTLPFIPQIPMIGHSDSNDMDPSVVESMARNIAFNGPEVQARVHPRCSDARVAMMQAAGEVGHRVQSGHDGGVSLSHPEIERSCIPVVIQKYDAVDLDPYGTPSMLLDTAVQCVSDGGVLMVTATGVRVGTTYHLPHTFDIPISPNACHSFIHARTHKYCVTCVACVTCRYGQPVRQQPHQLLLQLRLIPGAPSLLP